MVRFHEGSLMISRRVAAVAVCLLTFAGCNEDPTVVTVTVAPTVAALAIVSDGGEASSAPGTDGTGGAGGSFQVTTTGLLSLGSPSFVPVAPITPAAPTTGSFTAGSTQGNTSQVGTILIDSTVTASNGDATAVTVTSSSGDIVVSGALLSGTFGTVQPDINLVANNGTVYVTGAIVMAGSDTLSNGSSGGNLSITAARVVITGTIDTHGVANTTVVGANGGKGGNVNVISLQGPIFFTGGSIYTGGGACVDLAATPTVQGGAGGFVHLNSATAVNSVYVFAPITTDGGAVNGNGTSPTGGAAGPIAIRGLNEVNIVTSISAAGGVATGAGATAIGGLGGTMSVDGAATVRLYGSLFMPGGTASAAIAGGLNSLTGGQGGVVLLGQAVRLSSAELGQGTYSCAGGLGLRDAGTGGGQGGTVAVESYDGEVTVGSSFSVAGGAAAGAGNSNGGAAGTMKFVTDNQVSGNLTNHPLSIPSLASLLDASGGAAAGTGTGGAGGSVLMQSGGTLTSGARITVSGGTGVSGSGGPTTPINPPIATVDPSSAVALRVAAANLPPSGDLIVTGTIQAQGGITSSGGAGGGAGSSITLQISAGNGSLSSSADLNTTGGTDVLGAGGASGSVFVSSKGGNLDLAGTVTVSGASSPTVPTASGNLTITSGGLLTSEATVNAIGGASTDPFGIQSGAAGGVILFNANGLFGGVAVSIGVTADGGSAPGAVPATKGGDAGTITFQSKGQPITMTGSLLARGGAVSGIGTGGMGGQVIAVSDVTPPTGTAGTITLTAGSVIDVSGGAGSAGGNARQNGSDPGTTLVTSGKVPTLGVIFDANNGLDATGAANPGMVLNLGGITAAGGGGAPVGLGGDVFFNGLNSSGLQVTSFDGGSQNLTGLSNGQFWPH
jgi:hypothetical protein